jgi:serine/threonine-protein kinase
MSVVDEANKSVATEAPSGSTLTLTVSNGPDQRAVPAGLENQPKDAAVNALKALRLNPQIKEDFNETVPKDTVISVDPAAGTKLDVDAVVMLTVSKGPGPRAVPPTAGLSAAAASAALEGAGFKVRGIQGSATKTVLTTDPPAGESQPYGTQILIIMRTS